jgi:hypothetical protein
MISEPDYEGPGSESVTDTVPDDAPEADVLEQRQTSIRDQDEDSGVPIEADPADVDDQRRDVGDPDEDDYR